MTKLTKKLFVSIMTLVLVVMALSTSTFAWFSMNTTVNANGMTVTAKSNATYLIIGQGTAEGYSSMAAAAKAAAIRTEAEARTGSSGNIAAISSSVAGNVVNNDYTRYPCDFNATANTVGIKDLNGNKANDGTTAWTTGDKYTGVASHEWYTASNKNSNDADDAMVGVKVFDETSDGTPAGTPDFNDYVVEYTYYLTLSVDSEPYLTGNTIGITYSLTSGDAATSAVVKIEGSYYKLNSTNLNATHTLLSDITKDTALEVKVFIYIDGNSTNVYSDYINGGQTISGIAGVQFDLLF